MPYEKERIEQLGGRVVNNRVEGLEVRII